MFLAMLFRYSTEPSTWLVDRQNNPCILGCILASLRLASSVLAIPADAHRGMARFGLRRCHNLHFQRHQGIAHVVARIFCDSLEIRTFVRAVGFLVQNCREQAYNLTTPHEAEIVNIHATADTNLLL